MPLQPPHPPMSAFSLESFPLGIYSIIMPAATITTVERRLALASNMLAPLLAVLEAEAAEAEEEAEAAAALVAIVTY